LATLIAIYHPSVKGGYCLLSRDKIQRISELARKSKTVGLSEEERIEQQQLRQEYLKSFREEFRKQLDTIKFVEDDDSHGKFH
jgi:uncharacterized protein YnzC (UPF0291/DUF896 family)